MPEPKQPPQATSDVGSVQQERRSDASNAVTRSPVKVDADEGRGVADRAVVERLAAGGDFTVSEYGHVLLRKDRLDSLPAELAKKVQQRGAVPRWVPSPRENTLDKKLPDQFFEFLTLMLILAAVIAGFSESTGDSLIWIWEIWSIGLTAIAGLGAITHVAVKVWIRGDPLRLSRDERDELEKHDMQELWTDWYWKPRDDNKTVGSKEAKLVCLAADLVKQIQKSPAWASGYLDTHKVRFNTDEELRQLAWHAYDLRQVRRTLGDAPEGDTPNAVRAREAWQHRADALYSVWIDLVDRVAAIHQYRRNLQGLEQHLTNLAALERIDGADDAIANLLVNAAGDQLAAEHLRGLSVEVSEAKALIVSTLEILRGDLAQLSAAPAQP